MEIEEVDRVPFLARGYSRNRVIGEVDDNVAFHEPPNSYVPLRRAFIREVSEKNTYSEVRVVSTLEDSRRAAWRASWLLPSLSFFLSLFFSRTLSALTVRSSHLVATNLPEQG